MYLFIYLTQSEGSLGGVVSDVQDCDMMTGFELQSIYLSIYLSISLTTISQSNMLDTTPRKLPLKPIDLNDMLTLLGFFLPSGSRICVHCTSILTFLCCCFLTVID